MSSSTALVFGATGLTGRFVVSHLVKARVRTLAHVRPDSPRLAEWTERFTNAGAEVSSAAWHKDAIDALVLKERPSLVFGLLGTTQARVKEADGSITTIPSCNTGTVSANDSRCVSVSNAYQIVEGTNVDQGVKFTFTMKAL